MLGTGLVDGSVRQSALPTLLSMTYSSLSETTVRIISAYYFKSLLLSSISDPAYSLWLLYFLQPSRLTGG